MLSAHSLCRHPSLLFLFITTYINSFWLPCILLISLNSYNFLCITSSSISEVQVTETKNIPFNSKVILQTKLIRLQYKPTNKQTIQKQVTNVCITSSSSGTILCAPSNIMRTAACFIGQTRNWLLQSPRLRNSTRQTFKMSTHHGP